jgi:hypothetical protein
MWVKSNLLVAKSNLLVAKTPCKSFKYKGLISLKESQRDSKIYTHPSLRLRVSVVKINKQLGSVVLRNQQNQHNTTHPDLPHSLLK